MTTLEQVYDPRRNAFKLARIVLAVGVIFLHSFPLTGNRITPVILQRLGINVVVDSFFAISGYLVLASWERHPEWGRFVRARLARIIPGFWACLAVTAVVIAPFALLLSGQAFPESYSGSAGRYIKLNMMVDIRQYDIPGSLTTVPFPNAWNGSVWTLWWELKCYVGVLVLGMLGFFRWRGTLIVVFGLSLAGSIYSEVTAYESYYWDTTFRFVMMYSAGALFFVFRSRIPVDWRLLPIAAVLVVAGAWLPNYRLVAALPLAYLLIVGCVLLKNPRLNPRHDFSYGMYLYAFPVQQFLATLGVYKLGVAPFALIAVVLTAPFAVASWFWVERPGNRLRFPPGHAKAPSRSRQPADATESTS